MAKHVKTVNTYDEAAGVTTTEVTESVDATEPTKAIVGASITVVLAFLAAIITALSDNEITLVEWLIAVVACLTSAGAVFGGVYATTNKPKL